MTDSKNVSAGAPVAAKHPVTRESHGRSFVDNYEWLRDKESPETLDYLRAENDYTESQTKHLEGLSENIFQEIKSRIKETDMSVPVRRGKYWYYGRTAEGKNYGYSCRIPVSEGEDPWTPPVIPERGKPEGEQVFLDANELAEGHDFFALGAGSVSPSGRLLAYSVDYAGDERFELSIKDLETGELLSDRLTGIFYGATWIGEDYIFYTTVDDAWRPDKVWRHKVGTTQEDDVVIFEEDDPHFSVGVAPPAATSTWSWALVRSSPVSSGRLNRTIPKANCSACGSASLAWNMTSTMPWSAIRTTGWSPTMRRARISRSATRLPMTFSP